jgi:hypothetical protein
MILDTQYLGALADRREAARTFARDLTARRVPTRIPGSATPRTRTWPIYFGDGTSSWSAVGGRSTSRLRWLDELAN